MADMGIFDQLLEQCLVGQNLAGLSVYVNLSQVAQSPQAGQRQENRHAPHQPFASSNQHRLVGGDSCANLRQHQPAHLLSSDKGSDVELSRHVDVNVYLGI